MSRHRAHSALPDTKAPGAAQRTVFPTASAALAAAWAAAINGSIPQDDAEIESAATEPRTRTALVTRIA